MAIKPTRPLVSIIDHIYIPHAGKKTAPREGHRDLSEEEHYTGSGHEHNVQYDHEAFLGKEEAVKFDQLSKEEAKRRLG